MVERAFKGESYDDQLVRRFMTVLRSAREAVAAYIRSRNQAQLQKPATGLQIPTARTSRR